MFLATPDELYSQAAQNMIFSMQSKFLDNQAYWIQECRSTDLTRDQLVELNAGTGLPSKVVGKDKGKQAWIVVYFLSLVMTVGLHLKANGKAESFS